MVRTMMDTCRCGLHAFVAAAGFAVAGSAGPLAAQLGSQPAEQWALTLESGRRLASLDIDNVVAAIGLQPGDIVADIGAGTGIFSVPMARAVAPDGIVLAVEVDTGFLPLIEAKARENGIANIVTVLGEFGDPKLPRRDIDVAFFHDVLHHIEQRQAYLRTLASYMPAGSRVVIVDYDKNVPGIPHANQPEMLIGPEDVRDWMAAAGFELAREIEMFDDKFFVVYTKR
jgi:2-polyprenyl-3-methyl-5-hydroxy-6-metoxy-1,4-benzoquinol methylase